MKKGREKILTFRCGKSNVNTNVNGNWLLRSLCNRMTAWREETETQSCDSIAIPLQDQTRIMESTMIPKDLGLTYVNHDQ